MLYLFLDESGDLGFDFVNKRPSNHFTVTIVAVGRDYVPFTKAVTKTLARKINPQQSRRRIVHELKGSNTTLEVKRYFYEQVKRSKFGIYSITLNKRRVYETLARQRDRVYNFLARQVIDQIPIEQGPTRVHLIVDKSKPKPEIVNFNEYLYQSLQGRLSPQTPLDIHHWRSHEAKGLQAADLFAWGIFRRYERGDASWYSVFQEKIKFETLYLPNKKE